MQENNNFQSIISSWRRRSEESQKPLKSMSGDSSDNPHKNKEESELLTPDKSKIAVASAVVVTDPIVEEQLKQMDLTDRTTAEETKEAAGDSIAQKGDDYLEHNDIDTKSSKSKEELKNEDNVDSVLLKSPPNKVTSNVSSNVEIEEVDCIVNCLYWTFQCCDCVIM